MGHWFTQGRVFIWTHIPEKNVVLKKEKPHKTTIKSSERRISRGFMVHFCVFDKCSICEKNIGVLRGGAWEMRSHVPEGREIYLKVRST